MGDAYEDLSKLIAELEQREKQNQFLRTEIAMKIRTARRNAGFTQTDLAQSLNMSQPYISNIETSASNASVEQLWDVYRALNTSSALDNSAANIVER